MDVVSDRTQSIIVNRKPVVDAQHIGRLTLVPQDRPHSIVVVDLNSNTGTRPPQVIEIGLFAAHADLDGQLLKLETDRAGPERLAVFRNEDSVGVGGLTRRFADAKTVRNAATVSGQSGFRRPTAVFGRGNVTQPPSRSTVPLVSFAQSMLP